MGGGGGGGAGTNPSRQHETVGFHPGQFVSLSLKLDFSFKKKITDLKMCVLFGTFLPPIGSISHWLTIPDIRVQTDLRKRDREHTGSGQCGPQFLFFFFGTKDR